MLKIRTTLLAVAVAIVLAGSANAADLTASLTKGTIELKSAGQLAFAADGVMFIGDSQAATIYAVATEDTKEAKFEKFKIEGVNEKIANPLGVDAKQLGISDLATNPISGNIYFSVSRGKGNDAKPAIVRVTPKGKIEEFSLKDVKFSKVAISNPVKEGPNRQYAITQMAFVKDRLYVAGLSNEEFESTFRSIPFPFKDSDKGTGIKIYHGAHGKFETNSPVRTVVACEIKGEATLLAAYQCTPLVKIPISQLKPGEKVTGTTVAELGNGNRPLDMITYTKDGKEYLLMANNKHGVLKIPTEGIEKVEGIEKKIDGTSGQKAEKVAQYKGVTQLDNYGKTLVVMLMAGEGGAQNLEAVDLP